MIAATTLSVGSVSSEHDVVCAIDVASLGLTEVQKEYPTELGFVDIMAVDGHGCQVPIEVKFGEAGDSAVGQILGYMKAVCAKNGMVVAASFSERVKAVCKDMNIALVSYTCDKDMRVLQSTTIDSCPYYAPNQCDYVPRYTQGSLIEQMKTYANTEIDRKDFATMNCTTFTDLMDICSYIEEVENIGNARVYPALCDVGRDQCYRKFKHNGDRDVFSDIADLLSICRRSIDDPSLRCVTDYRVPIFNDMRTTKFRTTKQTLATTVEQSETIGIKTSHINLYYALSGLKWLTDSEDDYILLSEKTLFVDALRHITRTNDVLNEYRKMLQSWIRA